MNPLRSAVGRVKSRSLERRMPMTVELTDFDSAGVKFWVTNTVEWGRVVSHGDESEYMAAMLGALRPDDVFYDIGGNVGLVCLHAGLTCETHTFEPDPEFADHLAESARRNPRTDVTLYRIAIGEKEGQMPLFTDGAAGNSPSLADDGSRPAVSVPVRTLDSLVSEGLPSPTVVKLDIEGAEILALRGGCEVLADRARGPRAIFVEVHETFLPRFGSSTDEVLKLLAEYGYNRTLYDAGRAEQRQLIVERA